MERKMTKKQLLDELEYEAKKPSGPCGRVTFGLWWQQEGIVQAENLFSGSQLDEVKNLAYLISRGD